LSIAGRILAGAAAAAIVFTVAPVASASAAPAAAKAATNTAPTAPKPSWDDDCNYGSFCVYSSTNRNHLCLSAAGNLADWGSCANDGESYWNNGSIALYDVVDIYWGRQYSGAFACIGQGDYWALAYKNHYDHVGEKGGDGGKNGGRSGLGESLANDGASHKWNTSC
jgi:hypothetical protein